MKKITKSNEACRHNDVIKWKHFLRHWPLVRGIHWSPVNSPHKGQWHGALMFSLICAWIDGWVNNREAGDVIRHRAHYDVTVMVPVPACHPGYYPGTLSCRLVTMQFIVCGPGCGRCISKWVAETNNRTGYFFYLFLFQIYLYRVDHSVRLFFHGALLQNKIYIQKWHSYIYIHT